MVKTSITVAGNTSIDQRIYYDIPTNAVIMGIVPNLIENSAWCHIGFSDVTNTGLVIGLRNMYSATLTFEVRLSISYFT